MVQTVDFDDPIFTETDWDRVRWRCGLCGARVSRPMICDKCKAEERRKAERNPHHPSNG